MRRRAVARMPACAAHARPHGRAGAWQCVAAALSMLLLLFAFPAFAQTRAWLDRDRISMGETTTLNIETDLGATPDYAPLLRDFDLGGQASQQRLQWVNGQASARALYAVALRPRRDGLLPIPALRVGGRSTSPLTLLVAPAPASSTATGDADVFIESEADTQDPYVQQSVGWVVRLYSAIPLIAGRLDQDEPAGASLQRIGDDVQYRRRVGNRDYAVTERRYLLVPERSGELAVPAARFDGRGTGNALDRLFGDGQDALHAVGRPRVLRVRPIPANAPQPWLPLRALSLRYLDPPTRAQAGSSATVTVEVVADGASAAQLPALEFPATDGVQVFAERPQSDESVVDGRPQVRLQRRFQFVPTRPGRLVLRGPRVDWWDSRAGAARVAELPPITLDVAPGTVSDAPAPSVSPTPLARPGTRSFARAALMVGVAAIALLLIVGAMVLRRRTSARRNAATPPPVPAARMERAEANDARDDAAASQARAEQVVPASPATSPSGATLRAALERGDLAAIDAALRALAGVGDLDGVIARLDDDAQRDAVDRLRRARWADGDPIDALARLCSAFAAGARWQVAARTAGSPLPPLYPEP